MYSVGIVSGAGVSWGYNLVYKESPFRLGAAFALLTGAGYIDQFHPFAGLFQNVADPAEAAYFAEHWSRDPSLRDGVPIQSLIVYGIWDGYFPPRMIDGLVVASGSDLAGPLVYEPAEEALDLAGLDQLDLPAGGNREWNGGTYSSLVVQYATPEGVNGHYAPFVLGEARHAYTCFVQTYAETGVATVPEPSDDPFGPCE
jgi:hypothetical protein